MKIKDSFFLVVLIPTITTLIVAVLILCFGNFDLRVNGKVVKNYEDVQGTWVMMEKPYSVLRFSSDSLMVRNDSFVCKYRYSIKDDSVVAWCGKKRLSGEIFTRNGLALPIGKINVILLCGMGGIDGMYIRKNTK